MQTTLKDNGLHVIINIIVMSCFEFVSVVNLLEVNGLFVHLLSCNAKSGCVERCDYQKSSSVPTSAVKKKKKKKKPCYSKCHVAATQFGSVNLPGSEVLIAQEFLEKPDTIPGKARH